MDEHRPSQVVRLGLLRVMFNVGLQADVDLPGFFAGAGDQDTFAIWKKCGLK
jgi:hypothetical protein